MTKRMICAMGFAAAVWALTLPAHAQMLRYHGIVLDAQRRLVIEQDDAILRIGIRDRNRPPGDYLEQEEKTKALEDAGWATPWKDLGARVTDMEWLVETRVQIIKPSGPNYFQSHGETYRVYIEGLEDIKGGEFGPGFKFKFETSAAMVRDMLAMEFHRLFARSEGIQREALFTAVPLVQDIYKEADLMPADLPDALAKSFTVQIRTSGPSLERNPVGGGRPLMQDLSAPHGTLPSDIDRDVRSGGPKNTYRPLSMTIAQSPGARRGFNMVENGALTPPIGPTSGPLMISKPPIGVFTAYQHSSAASGTEYAGLDDPASVERNNAFNERFAGP